MCSGINDNCNIYWSDWFIDCKQKIYSDIYLSININFTVLFEINYGHKLSIHLLYQVHIIEMFLVKSDVTVTKFLYLGMHQSKSSTSSFIEASNYYYRHLFILICRISQVINIITVLGLKVERVVVLVCMSNLLFHLNKDLI